jgi:O-antigen ligase
MSSFIVNSAAVTWDAHAEMARREEPLALSIARFLLIAALASVPWALGGVEAWAWAPLALVACVVFYLWGWGSVQQRMLKLVWSPLYLPLSLLSVLGVVQYAEGLTLDRSETRQALVLLAADIGFFFLVVQLFSTASGKTWRAFGLTVHLLASSLGLFAVLQFAAGEQRIYGQVATPGNLLFGPYVNPNHYAGLMEMLVPVAFFYIAEIRGRWAPATLVPLGMGAAVAVASLLLTGSRGGLLAFAAEVVIAAIVWRTSFTRRRGSLIPVTTAILAAVFLFAWLDPGTVAHRLGVIVKLGEPTWKQWVTFRKDMALDSLRMFRDHPLCGVGLGNFEAAYPRYQSFPSDLWMDYTHNDYLQALAETGVIGAVLITSALALFLLCVFRDASDRSTFDGSWIQLGATLGCCGLLVHSMFDFNLHIPANAAWFAALAGIAVSTPGRKEPWYRRHLELRKQHMARPPLNSSSQRVAAHSQL